MTLTLSVQDRVQIYTRSFLASHHERIIHLLYQPIIGTKAVNLYLTLWSITELEKNELTMSHRQLFTFFDVDVTAFLTIRSRLEAIDLLNVHYHKQAGYYVYELRQPLTAQQFFLDSHLNIHLLYKVGHNLYDYLESKFIVKPITRGLTNITKAFNEVYPEFDDFLKMEEEDKQYISSTHSQFKLPIHYEFDYELFTALLNKRFISTDVLNDAVKEQILHEAALYQFDAQMMSKIVLDCTDKDGHIHFDDLHTVASNYYKRLSIKRSDEAMKPTMDEKTFFETKQDKLKTLDERRQEALFNYKTKTPHEWLYILQNQTEVPNSYLEVVRMLHQEYKLSSEVINVLVEFVLARTDRLPKEYCRVVASSWAYKRIKTAEDAMKEVIKITEVEEDLVNKGEKVPTIVYRGGRKGHVASEPEWFNKHEEYRRSVKEETEAIDVDALEVLLQSFK